MKKLITFVFAFALFALMWGRCEGQTTRECVVATYTSQIGVRESTGHNDGFDVEKYLASTNLGKGYAWCAAFVNWSMCKCGVSGPRTAAWSPSWFPDNRITEDPRPGDVFGIYFQSKNRIAHVGFIDKWGDRSVRTVEGNTNEAGSREGDGVYRKIRMRAQIYKVARWIE